MKFKTPFYFLLLSIIIYSCGTYHPQYREKSAVSIYPASKEVEKTFYLIGDAGISPPDRPSDGLSAYMNYIKGRDTKGDFTIFLGDNIYPDGMPPEDDPERKNSEYYMDMQFKAVEGFQGETYFIPGNHEYYFGGIISNEREQNYVLQNVGEEAYQPQNGCPLTSIEVSEDVQLIMIDTQWYLEDWNRNPRMNKDCEIKTREKFFIDLELELEKSRSKTVVLAMHHPMFTNGTHGGYFAFKKHLYPTQSNFPLPILSSLVTQIRSQGGVSVQDRYNELYNKLMNRVGELAKQHSRVVFASGHEHTLQHIEEDGLIQVLSGSGAKTSYPALGKNGLFSYGGQGFAVVDVFTDGSSYVRYFGADEDLQPELLFEKQLYAPNKQYDTSKLPNEFPPIKETAIYKGDSLTQALFFQTVWGSKYQDAYASFITARTADFDTLYGGLKVIREGTDASYPSLRLEDAQGNTYRMRSLKKNALEYTRQIDYQEATDPDKEDLSETAERDFSRSYNPDFYTATHPYAFLAIPELAQSIGLFTNQPDIFYVPKQKALGNFNENFGNELYMLSLEPSESGEGEPPFLFPDDIETSDDILLKLREGREIDLDEEAYIKTRLFDMLIGDWDREPDHWRWAEYFRRDSVNVYIPIPKNRDDAFSSMEGTFADVARSIFGNNYQRHVYDADLRNLKWFNEEGINLDRALLQKTGLKQWEFIAKEIQKKITDSVIETAFNKIPYETQDQSLQDIVDALKGRRENLLKIAQNYYAYLGKLETIAGTNNSDYFEITRLENGDTDVKQYSFNEKEEQKLYFDQTFKKDETNQIWIYGLDGQDTFVVNGEGNQTIFMRIIGGQGDDSYTIKNGKGLKVYDHESLSNTLVEKSGANFRYTDVYDLNVYDYRKQISSYNSVDAAVGYNPDDGMRVGAQYAFQKNSFQRNPFSQKHVITGGYYFDTQSFDISYEGEYANILNDLNLSFGAHITSPNYVENYFGYGNETENLQDSSGYDANRVELQTVSAKVGMLRNSLFGSYFKLQGKFEAITVNSPITGNLNPDNKARFDDTNYFGTFEGIYSYRSFDEIRNPTRGMMFDLNVGVTDNFNDLDRIFGFLKTRLGFYNTIAGLEKLVLKTNVQSQFNFGNRFEFYQGVRLGGNNGLRAFREERFTGKSSLVGSADVRYSFNQFKIGLAPFQIGVYGGADLGRVWIPSGNSEKWHSDYGGGIWVNGKGGTELGASLFHTSESTRAVFSLGFEF